MVICVHTSHTKIKFTLQPQEQNSGRRVTPCSHTLCGGCCTQPKESSPLEPFRIIDFLVHFAGKYGYLCTYRRTKINFSPQLQEQKSGRRQTPCSSTLCGCWYTGPRRCCLLQHFQMRYFVVCTHTFFKSLKCVLCVSLHCEVPVDLQD